MKKILVAALACTALLGSMAFAEEKSPHAFSISVDTAYYPLSAATPSDTTGKTDDFAPLTGAYSGLEGRITGKYRYTIPTPLGDNPLTKGDTLVLGANCEVTPVSIMPGVNICWTPIAFLQFKSWAQAGTAWNAFGFQGLGRYNSTECKYDDVASCSSWYYEWGAEGLFQFDVAALWPGDWHHIVCLALYDVSYKGMTGMSATDVWNWQTGTEKQNGWYYYSSALVGYQMPLVLQTVGVQLEWQGAFDNPNDTYSDKWDQGFDSMSVNPVGILKFGDHDSLTVLLNFQTRRNFESVVTDPDTGKQMLTDYSHLKTIGSEWYFRRIAFSYTHSF